MSGDLVAWLREVLDDDEQVAQAALDSAGADGGETATLDPDGRLVLGDRRLASATTTHVLRQSPRQTLADVTAKRAILDEIAAWRHLTVDDCWYSCAQATEENGYEYDGCCDRDRTGKPCDCGLDWQRGRLVRYLAAPYADRPGYREEWSPA